MFSWSLGPPTQYERHGKKTERMPTATVTSI
jgi:hypothetical protein